MQIQTLKDILESAGDGSINSSSGLTFYLDGDTELGVNLSYDELLNHARENSKLLYGVEGFSRGTIVILRFDGHYENVVWFWATVLAGGIPAPSCAFSKIPEQREKQINHLQHQLQDPLFLTTNTLLDQFPSAGPANVVTIEQIQNQSHGTTEHHDAPTAWTEDPALLMLTSGSTGRSKAVCLNQAQIIAAISGKASVRTLPNGSSFLNWVGFDHVASLIEIHLQAMYLKAHQVHMSAIDVVSKPATFLHILSRHRVGRTFAPNSVMLKLRQALEKLEKKGVTPTDLDLSALHNLATGGEANSVDACAALSDLLARYGAPKSVIVPGFGMTETCAGAIFNLNFPEYDLKNGYELASLGRCMPGIQMRVVKTSEDGTRALALENEVGELEVTGDVVFKQYFNNPEENARAFTSDGWFKTGDRAILDNLGNLRLVGRSKEVIIINGVKYSPHEIEVAIQESRIDGVDSSAVVCFPYTTKGSATENICVAYAPTYAADDSASRMRTNSEIGKVVMLETGSSAFTLPLNATAMQKSTLGKISRAQVKSAFERGDYVHFVEENARAEEIHRQQTLVAPATDMEHTVHKELASVLEIDANDLGVETPFFDMGVNSLILLRLKHKLELELSLDSLSTAILVNYPTVRTLAAQLLQFSKPADSVDVATYDPVVTIQPHGNKTPLWLFHPGVGEVIVFFNLATYITDRPVHALRARGFESHMPPFADIDEAVSCYHSAIKRMQPKGPYALAGYSYGAMLAFETAKRLQAQGDQIQFLGSFNLPPHIKSRMQQLVWSECLLHLAYFLGLISEEYSRSVSEQVAQLPHSEAVDFVFEAADVERLKELGLTHKGMERWATLAFGLQSMAKEYEPTGLVPSIDIFVAHPLAIVAADKETWKEKHLSRWDEFTKTPPKIHDVGGSHYTMIDKEHVFGFQKTLRKAMKARGL